MAFSSKSSGRSSRYDGRELTPELVEEILSIFDESPQPPTPSLDGVIFLPGMGTSEVLDISEVRWTREQIREAMAQVVLRNSSNDVKRP
mgnify:CR=1 FL=1